MMTLTIKFEDGTSSVAFSDSVDRIENFIQDIPAEKVRTVSSYEFS